MYGHAIYIYSYTNIHRGGSVTQNLVDLATLIMKYPTGESSELDSIPLPISCSIVSGSQIQSIVTCSGFLDPGRYVILPLAFNHWPPPQANLITTSALRRTGLRGNTRLIKEEGSVPYVVSLFSAREVHYHERVLTRPGFLAQSLFLLADEIGVKTEVSGTCTNTYMHMCTNVIHVHTLTHAHKAFPRYVSL